MLLAILAAGRFAHFAALTVFFGLALFRLYGRADGARPALAASAWLVPATGVLWFCATAAGMTGIVSEAVSRETLVFVAGGTEFGRIWIARLGLAITAAVWVSAGGGRGVTAGLAALLLASVALTGHAQAEEAPVRWLHVGADALHLLAAGAWLGGLMGLAGLMRAGPDAALATVLGRFSRMGYGAVAVLVATGAVNGWLLVGSVQALASTAYGRLLAVKIALFLGMAALALANRTWVTPGLARAPDDARWLARLRRHVLAEQALGALVLAIVAVLGAIEPPA